MCFTLAIPSLFVALTARQTEGGTFSDTPSRGLPELINSFAIAPLRHLLGISDFHPSMNPDVDARAEVRCNMEHCVYCADANVYIIVSLSVCSILHYLHLLPSMLVGLVNIHAIFMTILFILHSN